MKKMYLLLSLLIPFFILTSCSQQCADEPDGLVTVDFSIELKGVTVIDNKVYAVVGESLSVASINSVAVSRETVNFRSANFFVDGYAVKSDSDSDASVIFVESGVGNHNLSIAATMQKEDSSLFGMAVNLPVVVVEKSEDLPSHAPNIGCHTYTVRVNKFS